jgi:DNA-binding beta-propeller fold protein YncE
MNKILKVCTLSLLTSIIFGTGTVLADDHGNRPFRVFIDRDVDTFAVLPDGVRFPEGITANPANGDIYVGTFDGGNQNKLLRFNRHGRLIASLDLGIAPLLGLEFDRVNQKVYFASVGDFTGVPGLDSKIRRVAADLSGLQDVAIIQGQNIGAPGPRTVDNPDGSSDTITFGTGARVPNAMVFDSKGNLFISDSFQGAVFKISNPGGCTPNCKVELFSHDPLFGTAGFPPFGANGLAFNKNESALFIANTGDDRVLKLELVSGTKKVSVFAESINGADGIVFDKHGRLWVAANQADEVVALNEFGKVIAKLGEFRGIKRNGAPDGLLFPASAVIVGDDIFVTNLARPLTDDAKGDESEEVTRWTISRMKLPHH